MKGRTRASIASLPFCAFLLSGCVTVPMGSPQPSLPAIQALQTSHVLPMAVGTFTAAPDLGSAATELGIRAVTLVPPPGQSYADYLGSVISADLAACGKLDPNSPLRLDGVFTLNEVHGGGGSTNDAHLAARFTLNRRGGVVFERKLDAKDEWPSAFVGAEAIPTAINHYTALYRELLQKLYLDPEFATAASK